MGATIEETAEEIARTTTPLSPTEAASTLFRRYHAVRQRTERLCRPLAIEDYVVTAMADASPAKWHLAHTTWFFETFVLQEYLDGYHQFDPAFAYLFNSYYVQAGERHCRAQRGLVTRPTVAEVYTYRHAIDAAMAQLLSHTISPEAANVIEIGMQHEQQHQELLVTDIKYLFDANPIKPAYSDDPLTGSVPTQSPADHASSTTWIDVAPGLAEFGYEGPDFAYDNEGPRHPRYLYPARIATQLVTNAEYAEFITDNGYRRAELWLSAGFGVAQENAWDAPLYWTRDDDAPFGWRGFTMSGLHALQPTTLSLT